MRSHTRPNFARPTIAVIAIACVLSLGSCTEVAAPVDCGTQEWLPLVWGDTWTYSGHLTDTTGAIISGSDFIETRAVQALDTVGGRPAWRILVTRSNGPDSTFRIAYTSCGAELEDTCQCGGWSTLAQFGAGSIGLVSHTQKESSPLPLVDTETGDIKWFVRTTDDSFYNLGTGSVVVPRGTYSVLVQSDTSVVSVPPPFHFDNNSSTLIQARTYWFNKGIGIVKIVERGRVLELRDFSLH